MYHHRLTRGFDLPIFEDYLNKNKEQNTFIKPKFPTRRWGNVYTKTSTTDIKLINSSIENLKIDGFDVRKNLEKKNNLGKFYQIQINNHPNKI